MKIEIDIKNIKPTSEYYDIIDNINSILTQMFEDDKYNGDIEFVPEFNVDEVLENWNEKYKYLVAEFDTYRRNMRKKLDDANKYKHTDIIISLLDIIDDCERGLAVDNENQGLYLIYNKYVELLNSFDVTKINIEIGEPFNEETMNAISVSPISTQSLDNTVANIVKSGYMYKDKIIRYADVIVYKNETH